MCTFVQGEEDVIRAVKAAVRCGYRHIDCAAIYRNERAVGHALKELFVEGIIQREDIFVVSKVFRHELTFCDSYLDVGVSRAVS